MQLPHAATLPGYLCLLIKPILCTAFTFSMAWKSYQMNTEGSCYISAGAGEQPPPQW